MRDDAVEADLLAAIAADVDAIEPRLIYADWLQGRDDPRGELMVVQVGRLAKPDDMELETRERELTTELTNGLILQTGAVPLSTSMIVRWHLGFVDALRLDTREIRLLRTTHREWFAQPAFAAVRELDIDSKYARTMRFIRHLGLTNTIRRLQFGDHTVVEEPTVEAIVRHVPKLAALTLRTSVVPPLVALRKVPLRELVLDVRDLTDDGIRRIMEVPWALETFGIKATMCPPDRTPLLAPLYDGSTLATVKHFMIGGGMPVLDVLATIATSKRADTLETFTGHFAHVPYEQLARLEPHRDALAKLQVMPMLGQGTYYDAENCMRVGSILNYRFERPGDALPHYQRGLRIRPEDSTLRHNLGVALRKLGRLDESLIAFDTLINHSKAPTASMYNGRHYTLCELGRRADARADLERALKLEPNYADAWNNLGVERQYMGDADGALAAFRRCQEIAPQHAYASGNEGDLLLELGRAEEARVIYERLLAQKPGNASVLMMLAQAQLQLGDAAAARATLDARYAADDRHARVYLLRAVALRALGEHTASRADLDEYARTSDCPGWLAIVMYVRSLDEPALAARVFPASAVAPRQLAEAVIAFAKTATATELHVPDVDDQLDCAEVAIAAALVGKARDLAVHRARAAAVVFAEQGPRYFRKWLQTLATIFAVTTRDLDDDSRALLSLVMRALRGRTSIADVVALDG